MQTHHKKVVFTNASLNKIIIIIHAEYAASIGVGDEEEPDYSTSMREKAQSIRFDNVNTN